MCGEALLYVALGLWLPLVSCVVKDDIGNTEWLCRFSVIYTWVAVGSHGLESL